MQYSSTINLWKGKLYAKRSAERPITKKMLCLHTKTQTTLYFVFSLRVRIDSVPNMFWSLNLVEDPLFQTIRSPRDPTFSNPMQIVWLCIKEWFFIVTLYILIKESQGWILPKPLCKPCSLYTVVTVIKIPVN